MSPLSPLVSKHLFNTAPFNKSAYSPTLEPAKSHSKLKVTNTKSIETLIKNPNIQTPSSLLIAKWEGTTSQHNALKQLKQRFEYNNLSFFDDEIYKWFLRDRYYDIEEAELKLKKLIQWKNKINYDNLSWPDVKKEAASGTFDFYFSQRLFFNRKLIIGKIMVFNDRDVLNRLLIVIKPKYHIPGQFSKLSTEKLLAYTFKTQIEELANGYEESNNFLLIFDLRGFQAQNFDLELIQFIITLLFVYYPRRIGQCLILEAPWVFKPFWKVFHFKIIYILNFK